MNDKKKEGISTTLEDETLQKKEDRVLAEVGSVVEKCLARIHTFDQSRFHSTADGGQNVYDLYPEILFFLSTHTEKVDVQLVNSKELVSYCGTICSLLQVALYVFNRLETEKVQSADITDMLGGPNGIPDMGGHSYLRLYKEGIEIIIDPTIGQFLEGHNHVFIGTRNQLRDLILEHKKHGYGLINSRYRELFHDGEKNSKYNPEKFFLRYWGNTSQAGMTIERLLKSQTVEDLEHDWPWLKE